MENQKMENQMKALLDALYQTRAGQRRWDARDFLGGNMPFEAWQSGLLETLRQALALPTPPRDLEAAYGQAQAQPYGTLTRVTYLAEEGLRTPAYLLTPRHVDERTPVILCLHGHGVGSKDIVGLCPQESYQKRFAQKVCEAGMIAIAPEMAGFGELRLPEELENGEARQSSCHRLAMNLLACGRSLLGMRVNQAMRALDLAQQRYAGHPLGVMGISGGATVSTLTMALDQRLCAGVISGYANTFADSILAMHHCVDNYWPDMVGQMEMPDLLCAIAPRPMLWETGDQDPIYPQPAARKAAGIVSRCYEQAGAGAQFEVDAFAGKHEIHGERAYRFLKEHCEARGVVA